MMPRLYLPISLLMLMSACDQSAQTAAPARSAYDQCIIAGLSPETDALKRCVAAPDDAMRRQIIDEETYGTN